MFLVDLGYFLSFLSFFFSLYSPASSLYMIYMIPNSKQGEGLPMMKHTHLLCKQS